MGNIITTKYSNAKTTRDGRRVYLSQCFYKYEDRNINIYSSKEDDLNTVGGQFWEVFWNLWRTEPRFKSIVKGHHFQPTKRRVTDMTTGRKVEKWSLQFNHWLPIIETDLRTDETSGLKIADVKRQESFNHCLEEIMPILSRHCPQYLAEGSSSTSTSTSSTSSSTSSRFEINYGVI